MPVSWADYHIIDQVADEISKWLGLSNAQSYYRWLGKVTVADFKARLLLSAGGSKNEINNPRC